MHLLVDADSLCYRAGFVVNEPGQEDLACWQLDGLIERILECTQCTTYQLYITGSNNFRYQIYPEYKGNRVDMARPIHLQTMREHLITKWAAAISDGCEADDCVGIAQCTQEDTCIAGIDKDLLMIPGKHFNYNKEEFTDISDHQAMFNFYMQLIQGDKGDNIPGYDGKMRPKLPQKLYGVRDAIWNASCSEEMFDIMLGYYQYEHNRMDIGARCLWIHRKEDDDWTNYLNENTMEEFGLLDDLQVLLQARFVQPVENGLLNTNV